MLQIIIMWITSHPIETSSAGIAVLSEAMPYLPTKANGIAHFLTGLLTRFKKAKEDEKAKV